MENHLEGEPGGQGAPARPPGSLSLGDLTLNGFAKQIPMASGRMLWVACSVWTHLDAEEASLWPALGEAAGAAGVVTGTSPSAPQPEDPRPALRGQRRLPGSRPAVLLTTLP